MACGVSSFRNVTNGWHTNRQDPCYHESTPQGEAGRRWMITNSKFSVLWRNKECDSPGNQPVGPLRKSTGDKEEPAGSQAGSGLSSELQAEQAVASAQASQGRPLKGSGLGPAPELLGALPAPSCRDTCTVERGKVTCKRLVDGLSLDQRQVEEAH